MRREQRILWVTCALAEIGAIYTTVECDFRWIYLQLSEGKQNNNKYFFQTTPMRQRENCV